MCQVQCTATHSLTYLMYLYVCTLQGVVDVERQLGGTLVDSSRHILFQFNGGNLSLSIDAISYGWRLKQTTASQVSCHSWCHFNVAIRWCAGTSSYGQVRVEGQCHSRSVPIWGPWHWLGFIVSTVSAEAGSIAMPNVHSIA